MENTVLIIIRAKARFIIFSENKLAKPSAFSLGNLDKIIKEFLSHLLFPPGIVDS